MRRLVGYGCTKSKDLAVSAIWMQTVEEELGRGGAYDTLRCDWVVDNKEWNIWGQEYHLERLQQSYLSLANTEPRVLERAVHESNFLIRSVLREASDVFNRDMDQRCWSEVYIEMVKFTWLWTPTDDPNQIDVRVHAVSDGKPKQINKPAYYIQVSIGADASRETVQVDSSLPSRVENPNVKVSSWARLRGKISNPYQPPEAAEVLMVRQSEEGDLQVLEGLSSNVFVLYKDGTLRTASDGVLHGYVRHLVLEAANDLGIPTSHKPILLHESDEWKEAFITSSSRLVFPIESVLIHNSDTGGWDTRWKADTQAENPTWQKLLNAVLLKGGYAQLC